MYKIDYERKIVNFGKLGEQLKDNKISLEEFIIEDNKLVISFDKIKEIAEQIRDFTPKDKKEKINMNVELEKLEELGEDEDWKNNDDG